MTKKQFIWLVIRFTGVVFLFPAVNAVLILPGSVYNLVKTYPYAQASTHFASYLLISQALASLVTILLTIYLLFFGRLIYTIVDKSAFGESEFHIDAYKASEIMIRFIGVYFLWAILGRLCIAVYSAAMLARFKSSPADFQQIISKNEILSQHFRNLQTNLTLDSLLGIVILGALAFYFLKRGKLIIDIFLRRWLPQPDSQPEQPQAPETPPSET